MRYHIPIRLRWSDLDAYNHVNNSKVLSLLEEARVRAFWAGEDPDDDRPLAVIEGEQGGSTLTLIARHEIEYLAPIDYQDRPLDVQLWASHLGSASCEVGYEIWNAAGTVRYVIAASTIVFIDAGTGRPRRMTEAERTAWTPYLEEAPAFRRTRSPRHASPAPEAGLSPAPEAR